MAPVKFISPFGRHDFPRGRPVSAAVAAAVKFALLIIVANTALAPFVHAGDGAPDAAEQDRILAAMHHYADEYVAGLPNFLCDQTTRQFEAGLKSEKWHKGDVLTSKLSFHDGRENRVLDRINGKPPEAQSRRWRMPLTTEGEFGILLSQVLGEQSEANFVWSGWETLRGKRLAVFDFTVDQEHSTLKLVLGDLSNAVIPYSGSVYGDPETGAVWRIADTASKIPAALRTRQISTTIDYDRISIGDQEYLLPVEASVSLLLDDKRIRNDMEFAAYRKFTADSSITFESGTGSGSAQRPKR